MFLLRLIGALIMWPIYFVIIMLVGSGILYGFAHGLFYLIEVLERV